MTARDWLRTRGQLVEVIEEATETAVAASRALTKALDLTRKQETALHYQRLSIEVLEAQVAALNEDNQRLRADLCQWMENR